MLWPDGGYTPFRGEKNSNWEGGYRVPMMVRWPDQIKAGQVSNEIIAMMDWMPTLLAAAGDQDIKSRLMKGARIGGKEYKVHLDGYDFLPYFTGKEEAVAASNNAQTLTAVATTTHDLARLRPGSIEAKGSA